MLFGMSSIMHICMCTAQTVHKVLHLGIHLDPSLLKDVSRVTAMIALWTSLGKPNTVCTHYVTQRTITADVANIGCELF